MMRFCDSGVIVGTAASVGIKPSALFVHEKTRNTTNAKHNRCIVITSSCIVLTLILDEDVLTSSHAYVRCRSDVIDQRKANAMTHYCDVLVLQRKSLTVWIWISDCVDDDTANENFSRRG